MNDADCSPAIRYWVFHLPLQVRVGSRSVGHYFDDAFQSLNSILKNSNLKAECFRKHVLRLFSYFSWNAFPNASCCYALSKKAHECAHNLSSLGSLGSWHDSLKRIVKWRIRPILVFLPISYFMILCKILSNFKFQLHPLLQITSDLCIGNVFDRTDAL